MQAGSQVSLEYDINLSLTQIPENLIFYSDSARTNAIYKENGAIHLEGYFNQATANKTESRTLYWEWPMETGSTQNQINENDMLDSNWIGERIVLAVSAKGRQVTEENLTQQYAVTFDANGGTINGYGNSSQATKMVTYGETYGNLPTPTREGYTFKGWNGKNMFDEESILMAIPGAYKEDGYYVFDPYKAYLLYGYKPQSNEYVGTKEINPGFQVDKQYSISMKGFSPETRVFIGFVYSDGTATIEGIKSNNEKIVTVVSDNGKTVEKVTTTYGNAGGEAHIKYIQLEEGTTATAYEPYYITSSTEVVQNQNHTLTAIWEPKSN